jgi:hypothetical protein
MLSVVMPLRPDLTTSVPLPSVFGDHDNLVVGSVQAGTSTFAKGDEMYGAECGLCLSMLLIFSI